MQEKEMTSYRPKFVEKIRLDDEII